MKNVQIDFKKNNGLIPVIIQEAITNEVLMLGYMNNVALQKTLRSKFVWFWSRSKKRLWMKGETSGDTLQVKNILVDCDIDSLLIRVVLRGKSTCHTKNKTCFFKTI